MSSPSSSRQDQRALHRVNANFSEDAWQTLQQLAERTGRTASAVIRDGLALLTYIDTVEREGGRLLVERGQSIREVVWL